uniref:Probable beta-glucosidase G n=1 Tax=Alexandrium catenella TaxID=2925 RepID=A0A7S1WDL8_ALECA|mmetsp:Transcript_51679/g.138293  ORF Transcript_51679/g.138293 Transcript_51679/m.138293 type:complete len:709 (+) Transcript_51679:71-2197(+)
MPSRVASLLLGGAAVAEGLFVVPDKMDFASQKTSLQRADAMLSKMSLMEKINMLHGTCMSCPYVGLIPANKRLGIPQLNLHDGPQGFRSKPFTEGTTTSWPGAMSMAATWDVDAIYEWGLAMGKEFYDKGANVQLGPGLNVARVPVNGRNFEYLSGEDPYLGYVLAKPVTKGIQENKVIACGKHYVGNSQEAARQQVSEDIDERTLFEMYYPSFQAAVDAGVGSIMCSYNRLNGTHACENAVTLGHLKNEMGFQGFVMSDWGATHTPSMKQGLDMEMPIGIFTHSLALKAVNVSQPVIDEAVSNTVQTMFKLGVMDEPPSTWDAVKFFANVSTAEHIDLARHLSAQSTVLLKNADSVLPLPQGKKLALIGFAGPESLAISFGHGSGEVYPSSFVTPLDGITAAAGPGATIGYESGVDLQAAVALAGSSDYAVVFVGASAAEGGDRTSLSLDGGCQTNGINIAGINCSGIDKQQNALVSAVARANSKTVVVASVPGAFLMPWVHEVEAVLTNFMPGQQVGHAVADVLFGKVNPSARLPITLPNKENEQNFTTSQYPGAKSADNLHHAVYSEQLLVGYRYYDAHNISFTQGFPFGHGLSYTSFAYSGLSVSGRQVGFTVKNTGSLAGREVAQLYLAFPSAAGEPLRQLKGFRKTALLAPNAEERVSFTLSTRDTSIWDVPTHRWAAVSGMFGVHVGSSSRDIRLQGQLQL